jgi:hypothetical protein
LIQYPKKGQRPKNRTASVSMKTEAEKITECHIKLPPLNGGIFY